MDYCFPLAFFEVYFTIDNAEKYKEKYFLYITRCKSIDKAIKRTENIWNRPKPSHMECKRELILFSNQFFANMDIIHRAINLGWTTPVELYLKIDGTVKLVGTSKHFKHFTKDFHRTIHGHNLFSDVLPDKGGSHSCLSLWTVVFWSIINQSKRKMKFLEFWESY